MLKACDTDILKMSFLMVYGAQGGKGAFSISVHIQDVAAVQYSRLHLLLLHMTSRTCSYQGSIIRSVNRQPLARNSFLVASMT